MQSGTLYSSLSLADLESHDAGGGAGGRWCCPIDSSQGCRDKAIGPNHRSLEVYDADAGKWHCHRCNHFGTLKEKQATFRPKSRIEREADRKAKADKKLSVALEKYSRPEVQEIDPAKFTGLKARIGKLYPIDSDPSVLRYLADRGFKTQKALDFLHAAGVRYSKNFGNREATEEKEANRGQHCIVFGIRDNAGQLVAAQGRFLAPTPGRQKFQTEGGKNDGLFATPGALEALEAGEPVAVVEAPLDALSLALAGLPAFATCGTNGIPEWFTDRAYGRTFLLAHDNDDDKKGTGAGDKAAEAIQAYLKSHGGLVRRFRPLAYKDWNEVLQKQGVGGLREIVERELSHRKPSAGATHPNPAPDAVGISTPMPVESQDLVGFGYGQTDTLDREARTLRSLAAEMEADWNRQKALERYRRDSETDAAWWLRWRRVLLILDCLPVISWKMKQGVTVPNLAVWLRLALDRCEIHRRLYGPEWHHSPFGRDTLPDFSLLSNYLGV